LEDEGKNDDDDVENMPVRKMKGIKKSKKSE